MSKTKKIEITVKINSTKKSAQAQKIMFEPFKSFLDKIVNNHKPKSVKKTKTKKVVIRKSNKTSLPIPTISTI